MSFQNPTVQGLAEYLHYQHPSTKGDLLLNNFCAQIADLQSRLTAETRVKELEKDATRYRFLRNQVAVKDGDLFIARKSYDGRHTYLTLDERDRLIDAELDKLKGTK